MDWQTFAAELADDLAALPAGALLVISERDDGGRFAQFAQDDDGLVAYVCDNTYLAPDDQASPEARQVIAAAGWNAPDPRQGHEDWWYRLPWPASSAAYRRLTDMIAAAFRDGYGIASPDGWNYRAWNEREGNDPIELRRLSLVRAPLQ
ncbi:TY-Chap domain-containing protein [Actinomadura gamaensis]|uniref:TY-Chap N-terminal domain-containing protein n=1 Tax=Actinomadura gamaensis TaxID=1763541 RepID=A0ABV9UAW5_9ACTN